MTRKRELQIAVQARLSAWKLSTSLSEDEMIVLQGVLSTLPGKQEWHVQTAIRIILAMRGLK